MSASGLLGTRRFFLFLFATSSCRTNAASVLCSSSRFFASKTVAESEAKTCFTVSYLRNSCRLSLESAKYVSKHVTFESPERPDSVINLLKEEGFTDVHISKFIKQQPQILISKDLKKQISSKLEFFRGLGCSSADIVSIFSRNPVLLKRSLEKRIIPCYRILRSVLLSDGKVIEFFRSNLLSITLDPAILDRTIRVLREQEVPESSLSFLVTSCPNILFQRSSKLHAVLNEVKQMGFHPLTSYFVSAIRVFSSMSKPTVEVKLGVLERFGLSRDEAWTVFRKQPMIMSFSKEKIMKVMDFLLNQMKWKLRDIVGYPQVFLWSLEKRTIPRCCVAHVLLSKGLVKEKSLSSFLGPVEEMFVKKYVTNYLESMPQLLDIYKGRVSLAHL